MRRRYSGVVAQVYECSQNSTNGGTFDPVVRTSRIFSCARVVASMVAHICLFVLKIYFQCD